MLKPSACVIAIGIAVTAMTPAGRAQGPIPLLIPFNTSFNHSDHHWIAWMPTHPVYEAVEVRSTADARSPAGTSVQVFFTERAGGKNQVHYFNTEAAARGFKGATGLFRDIAYTATGPKGSPQALQLTFRDKDDRTVALSMNFAPAQALSGHHAGLANQMGHNRDVLFLLFFREKAASAAQTTVVIDGQDFSINAERATSAEQLSRTGYRSNVFVGTFPFGKSQYVWNAGSLSNSWRRTFTAVDSAGGARLFQSKVPDGTRLEVASTSAGELHEYRHLNGTHSMRVAFEPALPSMVSARDGQRIGYQISLDDFGVLIHGTAVVHKVSDRIVIDWRHAAPEWARAYHFQSIVRPTATGYDLEVRRAPASADR